MEKSKRRLKQVAVAFSFCLLLVAIRVFLLSQATEESADTQTVVRGPIEDRHGITLAVTEEASTIAIAPAEIYDTGLTAELLGKNLGARSEELLQKIYEGKNRKYFYIKRQVDNLTADQIIDLKLPGVYREREHRRYYPGGSLASNLLGFMGREQGRALEGLERDFNQALLQNSLDHPYNGAVLQLTLDSLIQHKLEQELSAAFTASGSKRAVGILMNIQTGEVLAMASLPNYDPNEYYRYTSFQRGNWSIRLNYEPGSTVKVFMAAILLAKKAVHPRKRFLCEGEIHFGESVIRCRYQNKIVRHGYLTLSEIIKHSCNVGIIKAMSKIKRSDMHEAMRRLGFGRETYVLPAGSGETVGYLPGKKHLVPSSMYYIPIGQGFNVTPIQLLRAGASIANGGRLVQPFVVRRLLSFDKKSTLMEWERNWERNPFPESVNRAVRKIMRHVVKSGTGAAANVEGIGVFGKTGTGEKSSAKGYLDKYVVSFIGFFPQKAPRYGALILFDEPKGHQSGGNLAAPVFKKFVRSVLPYLTPDSSKVKLTKLSPLPSQPLKIESQRLHDFRGLAARNALQLLTKHYKVEVKLKGSGYVYAQEPASGTNMKDVKNVTLYLSD